MEALEYATDADVDEALQQLIRATEASQHAFDRLRGHLHGRNRILLQQFAEAQRAVYAREFGLLFTLGATRMPAAFREFAQKWPAVVAAARREAGETEHPQTG